MIRPSFSEIFLDMAVSLSRRSTCRRLNVGCVIASADSRHVFGGGYNGGASGLENDCDRVGPDAVGSCGCLHAEQNAVINCRASRSEEKIVYCTHLPCVTCAKFLINLGGVRQVVYKNHYRIVDSIGVFTKVGIIPRHQPRTSHDDLIDNLTATQARCTELLEETRRLKGEKT
jgi:dCMP deaminase